MRVAIPAEGRFTLARARLFAGLTPGLGAKPDADGFVLCDIVVDGAKIASIAPRAASSRAEIDLGGRIVLPSFIDCHTHLDKGHIWPRKANPDGSFAGALQAAHEDRLASWSADDLRRRMEFSLRCAYAHGTAAIRTHLDSLPPHDERSWEVFDALRREWAGRIALQAACLFGIDRLREEAWFAAMARRVAAYRGVLGTVTYMMPDLDALLDRMFRTATEHGLDLDFHADETDDPGAVSLDRIAEAALRHGFAGRILVGHCCSLARQADDAARRTLDKVAQAGLAVVSLPMCNLYLQDRRTDGTTPRWRGVTLVHEMQVRGIPVAVASDNTRDPFYAYGDLDAVEVFRMATRILHLDHPTGDWIRAVTATPAAVMPLPGAGLLAAGGGADFTIFRGRSWSEFLSRPEAGRTVVRAGRAVTDAVPDYSELDDLAGFPDGP